MWADNQDPEYISLVKRAVDAACEHPEQFSMDSWKCGTVMCIGGWMCWLDRRDNPPIDSVDVSCWLNDSGIGEKPGFLNLISPRRWPQRFITYVHNPISIYIHSVVTTEQLRERFSYWLETGL